MPEANWFLSCSFSANNALTRVFKSLRYVHDKTEIPLHQYLRRAFVLVEKLYHSAFLFLGQWRRQYLGAVYVIKSLFLLPSFNKHSYLQLKIHYPFVKTQPYFFESRSDFFQVHILTSNQ